ncbi:hypothetical protein [Leptothoe sp. PORK10 BA2]|uniref:hypothetical protein n=1 Tax=Leptothoe sp. PORK10 BA2 TaxID=3110254 RepID=UPI002B2189B1|nr:hypothetical protein [Leptothoe sp. PORK10 BA2]MEA5467113.1 hypothetical protein [Leptothoe sp. PORK10 BA2]
MGVSWDILKKRFLQADQTAQLESLALNLTRIQAFVESGTGESVVEHLIRESQFFIEWIVPGIDLETSLDQAVELADLQRLLSRWKLSWSDWRGDEQKRQEVVRLSQEWCELISQRLRDRMLNQHTLPA